MAPQAARSRSRPRKRDWIEQSLARIGQIERRRPRARAAGRPGERRNLAQGAPLGLGQGRGATFQRGHLEALQPVVELEASVPDRRRAAGPEPAAPDRRGAISPLSRAKSTSSRAVIRAPARVASTAPAPRPAASSSAWVRSPRRPASRRRRTAPRRRRSGARPAPARRAGGRGRCARRRTGRPAPPAPAPPPHGRQDEADRSGLPPTRASAAPAPAAILGRHWRGPRSRSRQPPPRRGGSRRGARRCSGLSRKTPRPCGHAGEGLQADGHPRLEPSARISSASRRSSRVWPKMTTRAPAGPRGVRDQGVPRPPGGVGEARLRLVAPPGEAVEFAVHARRPFGDGLAPGAALRLQAMIDVQDDDAPADRVRPGLGRQQRRNRSRRRRSRPRLGAGARRDRRRRSKAAATPVSSSTWPSRAPRWRGPWSPPGPWRSGGRTHSARRRLPGSG